jgi:hypothetical protein
MIAMVPTLETIREDARAMAVARVLAVADQTALAQGIDLSRSLITITEESPPAEHVWRIHYGPREYVSRRGGDLMVLVDDRDGEVQRIIHGQ